MVAPELWKSSRSSADLRPRAYATLAPTRSGHRKPAVHSKVWWSGSTESSRSRGPKAKVRATASTFESRLACESITPLARPMVPEVKITTARSWGAARGGRAGSSGKRSIASSSEGTPAPASSARARSAGARVERTRSMAPSWGALATACVAPEAASNSPTSPSPSLTSIGTATAPASRMPR